MQEAPKFILDKQGSSARGAARTALALIHAHHPEVDLEFCTAGAPTNCDEATLFAQVQGLDNRVVHMIDHGTFYDKMPLTPVNIKRQRAHLLKEEAARRKEAEHPSEEAEQSEERSSQEPADDDATKEDSDASTKEDSDQASPPKSGSQEG